MKKQKTPYDISNFCSDSTGRSIHHLYRDGESYCATDGHILVTNINLDYTKDRPWLTDKLGGIVDESYPDFMAVIPWDYMDHSDHHLSFKININNYLIFQLEALVKYNKKKKGVGDESTGILISDNIIRFVDPCGTMELKGIVTHVNKQEIYFNPEFLLKWIRFVYSRYNIEEFQLPFYLSQNNEVKYTDDCFIYQTKPILSIWNGWKCVIMPVRHQFIAHIDNIDNQEVI